MPLIAGSQSCGAELEQAAARRRLFRHRHQATDGADRYSAAQARLHRRSHREDIDGLLNALDDRALPRSATA